MILRFSKSFLLVILLFACVQPVEITTDRRGESVIISGQLSNLPEQSVVFVGITADIERLPYPVSGAVVNLFQGNQFIHTFSEDQSNPGKYILNDSMGIAGKTYHIKVILPDNRIYESVPEKMPDDSGTVNSYYEIVKDEEFVDYEGILVKQPVVKIFANGVLPSSINRFIRWTVEEVFILFGGPSGPVTPPPCFVTQLADPQSIILLDRQYLAAIEFPDQLAATRIVDYSFEYNHYFVTYQSTLTQEAFNYWRKVGALFGQTGSLFDTPPAIILGNISNTLDPSEQVFGYFEATHQTLHRIKLTIDDFPFQLHFTDCSGQSGAPPLRCSNCLSVRNSSHIRPPWF
ncbi:MAG: hypothetical protein C0490_12415 [Marivirga sp.]|nr:hypothetical protein [Marivirga sp.]